MVDDTVAAKMECEAVRFRNGNNSIHRVRVTYVGFVEYYVAVKWKKIK